MTSAGDNDRPEVDRRSVLAAGGMMAAVLGLMRGANAQPTAPLAGNVPADASTVVVESLPGGVLLIGIDRQKAQNRIDPATFRALGMAMYRLDHDEALRVGVLHAHGPDFTPGIDLAAWSATLSAGPFQPGTQEFVNPLGTAGPGRVKPLVVAVQGATKFIGHELFLAADVRVAANDTVFSQGEAHAALMPGGGATVRFPREAGWANAMRYMLTGEEWGAEESLRLGLTQAIAPPGQQLDRAVDFAGKIARAAPLGVRATLASARNAEAHGEDAAYASLLAEFGALFKTEDFRERVRALRESRQPAYQGR